MLHPVRRQGRTDTLLLYWFRTPPYVKVGRAALDPEAMARLEQLYPDINFDWDTILREPPQALTEQEAARRKEQRDAREARRKRKRPVETAQQAEEPAYAEARNEPAADSFDGRDTATESAERFQDADEAEHCPADGDVLTDIHVAEPPDTQADADPGSAKAESSAGGARRRRRRRRGGRRRDGEPSSNPPAGTPPTGSV